MKIYADFYADFPRFTLKNARCAISIFAARFLRLNSPDCRGHSRGKDNAQSLRPEQAGRIPRACCRAASPALPAVPGCCRTHPRRRCSRWQEWCHLRTGFPPGWCQYCISFRRLMKDSRCSFPKEKYRPARQAKNFVG